eukprot:g11816.t1
MTSRADGRETLVVIGGGAAGYFGAIQAAASASGLDVIVLEKGRLPLQKVKISGGGRCNVMHDTSKSVSLIAQGYPRGSKQLIGPFKTLFGPTDAAAWFNSRGVRLKTEGDGRMFPVTDDSQTIIDCLEGAAREASVEVVTSARVTSITHREAKTASDSSSTERDETAMAQGREQQHARFELAFTTETPLPPAMRNALGVVAASAPASTTSSPDERDGEGVMAKRNGGAIVGGVGSGGRGSYRIPCDYVLQATGAAREGHGWARTLGHAVSAPVPSLFTLNIKDPRLEGLAGLSVQDAELKLFAEKTSADTPAGREHESSSSSTRNNADEDDPRDTTAVATAVSDEGGKKKKKKRTKRQPAVTQRGPLLITHSGVSGPAVLKLSAFGARVLNEGGYRGKLVVNWMAGNNPSKTLDDLQAFRSRNPKKTVYAYCPVVGSGAGSSSPGRRGAPPPSPPSSNPTLPRRLWQSLSFAAGVAEDQTWAEVSKAKLSALAQQLTACDLQIVGKGSFKEEFVTCGGVALSALDMRTMESKSVPGLFFAGEVVDVDGVTGGFNFQSAWTTGFVAGSAVGAANTARTAAAAVGCADGLRN